MQYKKIYLSRYWDSRFHVELENRFRVELFEMALEKVGGRHTDLAERLHSCRQVIGEWIVGKKWPTLHVVREIAKIAGIDEARVNQNLRKITALMHSGAVRMTLFLELDPRIAEWFGLLKGDGCISRKYVDCGNTDPNITLFFLNVLMERLGVRRKSVILTIRVPEYVQNRELDETVGVLKRMGFPVGRVRSERWPYKKKPLMIVRVNSKALATILRGIVKELKEILLTSPHEVKAGYLKGLYEAEGSIPDRRRIVLSMKDINEVRFAKKLLGDLGLREGVVLRRLLDGMSSIEIYRRRNMEKFRETIGFGHHSARNRRLKHVLGLYSYECFSMTERSEQVKKAIEENRRKVTATYVAGRLGISYQHACYLLNHLANKGELRANRLMRPYTYFLNE